MNRRKTKQCGFHVQISTSKQDKFWAGVVYMYQICWLVHISYDKAEATAYIVFYSHC